MRRKSVFYKNQYVLGIYEKDDSLIALLDNAEQLAKYLNVNKRAVDVLLSNIFNKKQQGLIVNKRLCDLVFIKVDEEDKQDMLDLKK